MRLLLLFSINFIYFSILHNYVLSQNYEVSDIQCSFSATDSSIQDFIAAKLKKPPGFKADPIFADDRTVNPEADLSCHIQKNSNEPNEAYDLKITDFSRCGVLKRNGFVHVRIWFPQYPGVVMHSDQELIIMCKPPEPTIIENKAAGFAGSFPHGARVSGIVEETPGRLEYQVALYKEAPPVARINGLNTLVKEQPTTSELPVDQAVPIGTKLQLRARIGTQSVWKYIKLLEVTVSPDPDKPYANGAVWLVRNGCRNRDFASIIPHQPAKYRDRPYEVFLDFEAFLLSSMTERATLWIHSQIKACVEHTDCTPDFCMDLYEHSGHGRKRRANILHNPNQNVNETIAELNMEMDRTKDNVENTNREYTRFEENLQYEVIMSDDPEPELSVEFVNNDKNKCRNTILVSVILTVVLLISFMGVLYILAVRIQMEQNFKTKYLFH